MPDTVQATPPPKLTTPTQRKLCAAVTARARSLDTQLSLVTSLARTVGASEADIRAVRAVLEARPERECRG